MQSFTVEALLTLNATGFNKDLSAASKNVSSFSSTLKKGLSTIAKVAAAGVATAGGAVVALTKSAVQAYANYEQLKGGVETIFGTGGLRLSEYAASVGKTTNEVAGEYTKLAMAEKKVFANAAQAYKTAGVSANDYMQQVTAFSAALISSLDGDSVEAARIADMAIIDMADNANKMGTSLELIQNAYQGFAKQNYDMLDNLKLGYGGTKEEMERLLADASKISNIEYDISNLDDVFNAIHVIQEEMGIANATYMEATTTIQGSLSMVGAAWTNLVTGMADDNADIGTLASQFAESVGYAAQNLLPRIQQALSGIGQVITELAPIIAEALPGLMEAVLPGLISAVGALLSALAAVLPSLLMTLLESLSSGLSTLFSTLAESTDSTVLSTIFQALADAAGQIPIIFQNIIDVGVSLVEWMTSGSANAEMFTATVLALAAGFAVFKTVIAMQELIENVKNAFVGLFAVMAAHPIVAIIAAIVALVSYFIYLWNNCEEFRVFWTNAWESIKQAVTDAWNAIIGAISRAWAAIVSTVSYWADYITTWLSDAWDSISGTVTAAWDTISGYISSTWETIKTTVTSAIDGVKNTLFNTWASIISTVNATWDTISSKISSIWGTVTSTVSTAINKVKTTMSNIWTSIKTTASKKWSQIKTAIQTPINNAKTIVKNAIDKIKGFFDFEFTWPKLKLPHFEFTGSWNPFDWPPVPSITVEWYKKAMNNAMLLTRPTIFGMDDAGKYLAGGEAGPEIVAGANTVMGMIRAAVRSEMQGGGGVVVNQNIYSEAKTAADLMKEAMWEAKRAVIMGV